MSANHPSIRKMISWTSGAMEYCRQLRWGISTGKFIITITLVNTAVYHLPLYRFAVDNLDFPSFNSILTLLTLLVLVNIFTAFVLFALCMLTVHLVKPFVMLMTIGNSIALYFVTTYQVVLDVSMMGNVHNTNFEEASDFLHPKLILYLFVFGVLPCWLLLKVHIRKTGRLRLALYAFLTVFLSVGWIYLASSTWLWFDHYSKKIGGMIMPWSYVINMARIQLMYLSSPQEQTLLPPATFTSDASAGKTVVVLVIGESARAQNFSFYGYDRSTNPLLTKSGAVALKNTIACSTYTTASMSCILSHTKTSSMFSEQYEPLPSYLQRHGIDVTWRSNNWGEPPLHVQSYQRSEDLRKGCTGVACEGDEPLLTGLVDRIQSSKQQNIFVVLHQKGSHGPSYYTRYPQQFEVFKPVCKSVELNQCTQQELLNAYDNTIVYNDNYLNRIISELRGLENTSSMLMYISDHGESLGEFGLYLHGTPFSIAPDVQKYVPFIVWMSKAFADQKDTSIENLRQQDSHSQNNIFHSIMGAFNMRSDVYNEQLDIFNNTPDQ